MVVYKRKDKKVAVDFVRPWDILLRYGAEWLDGKGNGVSGGGIKMSGGGQEKEREAEKITTSPIVWDMLNELRNFFQEKTKNQTDFINRF